MVPTWMEAQKNLQDFGGWKCLERAFFRMYPVALRKIVDYNHISPEKSRR